MEFREYVESNVGSRNFSYGSKSSKGGEQKEYNISGGWPFNLIREIYSSSFSHQLVAMWMQ